jgi:hypothetical protein
MGLFSKIKLKSILNAKPVSDQFGFDRGTPIDRFYIEKFLRDNCECIKGDVLEIAEDTYTKKFASGNVNSQILHYDTSNPKATVIGDLCNLSTLKENSTDCFICTQTYNFIYNFKDAIKGSHYILKPGGALLATVACMSPISKYDADRWGDYWRFTPQSAQKAFTEIFDSKKTKIVPLGNSAAASLFMKGYALEDLNGEVDLNKNDELFPLIIGIKAVK